MEKRIEKITKHNLEDILGYTPNLKHRFIKDLGLSFLCAKKFILSTCFSLHIKISEQIFNRLLFIVTHKTIKDFIKELNKYGYSNNTSLS